MSWDFRGREREVAALEAGWSATGDEDVPIDYHQAEEWADFAP